MGAEHLWLKRTAAAGRPRSAGDYERRDTLASLSMGVGSLVVPVVLGKVLRPVTPGSGRWGKVLVGTVIGAAAATTVADVIARRDEVTEAGVVPEPAASGDEPVATVGRARRRRLARLARKVSSSAGVTAVAAGMTAGATTWASRTAAERFWERSGHRRDLGTGVLAHAVAILGWDFIYYWNHRTMHESRQMWAVHVVHHSSEHYNLSTALRQPVADSFGIVAPMGALSLLGVRPPLIETARAVNLIYQFWIHTETIPKLGWFEEVFNTASHHRVHHGSNRKYLDRNHGSILIIWDRLFGTFQREDDDEPVVYGLTKNIGTFNPVRIATHEHVDILRDVAGSTTWSDRLGFVFRGPGWAYQRHTSPDPALRPRDDGSTATALEEGHPAEPFAGVS
ncbi:sterol desaturase family protein [Iamia sp. SCSIO 61187]|nr:sterol desaturase family protein [Iamia sp. SCSIO 61187]